ncbi:MAG TPA: hypothetical protein DCL41_09205 [Bdellovibrionales bacterium]|nr:hypothetical protein [Pseudobdellovibrionaceae bacterium]HAG92038.1 hypothetical protein [Bdellovibrionales bacterium]|tara:strand:+ start:3352 stop:4047 length:696 start_codon:yes stop_codon:yes gene_type:complete
MVDFNMKISSRSYRGKSFRPSPYTHCEDDGSLLLVVTPWGNSNVAERAKDIVTDFILSSRNDNEATSPFQKMTCITPLANHVRVAMMLLNDTLYREENREEYTEGVEIAICAKNGNEITIAQVGQPFIFLSRKGFPLVPLTLGTDLAAELSAPPKILSPLPHALLGLYSTSNFSLQSFHWNPGDQLIFLTRSHFPMEFLSLPSGRRTLDELSKVLSQDNSQIPFWLGITHL